MADRDAGQVRLTKVEREMLLEAVFGPNGRLVSDFVSPIFAVVESIKVAALAARQSDPDATERVEWGAGTVDGRENDCTHASASGVDTAPDGPSKEWRCDHCGLRWLQGRGNRVTQPVGIEWEVETGTRDDWYDEADVQSYGTPSERADGAQYARLDADRMGLTLVQREVTPWRTVTTGEWTEVGE